jgi:DNA-binding transcriptional MerR regulator
MTYQIGEVARISGVSVRTLHYYDEIGLVVPSARSKAAYRLYTDGDLERLQEVLVLRELGFPLERIAELLADPKRDRLSALREQRAVLAEQAKRSAALLALIDKTIDTMEKGTTMKPEEMFQGFDPSQYEEEVEARWGHTEAYAESMRRTKRYGKDDWAKIGAEANAINEAFAEVMAAGVSPSDERAMDIAERHRLHIDRWFYPCSARMHSCLGEMYVADARFTANYEKYRVGLASYIRDAIVANGARLGQSGR